MKPLAKPFEITYRETSKSKPIRLKDLLVILSNKKILPEGHWSHSYSLSAFDACRAWGIIPSKMGLCRPEENMAYMIATVESKAVMTAVDDSIATWEVKKNQPKETPHG